ncbi:hypothetical protein ACFV1F_15610 [Streptomyces sp. NPDC059590]
MEAKFTWVGAELMRLGEDALQQKPTASGSTLWSFEVVQQAGPNQS